MEPKQARRLLRAYAHRIAYYRVHQAGTVSFWTFIAKLKGIAGTDILYRRFSL